MCALALVVSADVSHLLRNQQSFGAPIRTISAPAAGHPVAILKQNQDVEPDGSYQYR